MLPMCSQVTGLEYTKAELSGHVMISLWGSVPQGVVKPKNIKLFKYG